MTLSIEKKRLCGCEASRRSTFCCSILYNSSDRDCNGWSRQAFGDQAYSSDHDRRSQGRPPQPLNPTFLEGGFAYLTDHGLSFENAQYRHANTETIVGHATLATGAHPRQHGMVGNVWFDRDALELAYNIEDPEHPLLPTGYAVSEGAQVDPAQKKSRTQGRSSAALLVPTLADMMFSILLR